MTLDAIRGQDLPRPSGQIMILAYPTDHFRLDKRHNVVSHPVTYSPRSMGLPQITHGPCIASPTYGQEQIVGRVYEGNIWYYRVEQRLRRHATSKRDDSAHSELQSIISQALRPSLNKYYATSSTNSSQQRSTTSSFIKSTSQDTSSSRSTAPVQYYLVPPEDILEHVSAAELEHFENNLVREEELEEENHRRYVWEKRQRAIDRREERAAAAKAQGLGIDMKHEELLVEQSESTPSGSTSVHSKIMPCSSIVRMRLTLFADTPVPTIEGGRMKRKAGEAAADRLAATPWTTQKRRLTERLKDTSLTISSASSPRPRGRSNGSGLTKTKGVLITNVEPKASPKPTSKAKGKAPIIQAAGDIRPADPDLHFAKIVRHRTAITKPYMREFEVAFAGSKNETRWMAEHELPQALIDDYDQEYDIDALISDCLVDGVRMFEVSWKGYPGENTFQSADTLPEDMVEEYLKLNYDEQREQRSEEEVRDQDNLEMDDESHRDSLNENESWTSKFIRGGL